MQKPHLTLSLVNSGDSLIQQLSDENQCPSYLSLSTALRHLSSLKDEEILIFFHNNIAEVCISVLPTASLGSVCALHDFNVYCLSSEFLCDL